MWENYCIIMTEFFGNFLSTLKQNIPYLKDRDVNPEVALGIVLHLFLLLCFLVLFYLLVRTFM